MAKNIGFKVRPVKEMEIFYGQDLVSGVKQTRTLPVSGSSKIWSGEVIFSKSATTASTGNPLPVGTNFKDNDSVWTKGTVSDDAAGAGFIDATTSGMPHFAVTDSDRFDVEASGKLLALVGTDTFQLGTCFYDHSKAYKDGDPLYVKQVTIAYNADPASRAGILPEFEADSTLDGKVVNVLTTVTSVPVATAITTGNSIDTSIVGYVVDGVIQLKGSEKVGPAIDGGMDINGYLGMDAPKNKIVPGGPALWTEATLSETMLKFTTKWTPAVVDGSK